MGAVQPDGDRARPDKDAHGGFFQPAGIIGSIIGAVIVLLIYTRVGSRHTVRH